MKTVCKKLLSLTLVAMLLVSAVPFQALATETAPVETTAATEAAVAPVAETVAETTVATETATAPQAEVEAEITNEDTATLPAVNAINDEAYIYFVLKDAASNPDAIIKTVKTKVGAPVSGTPSTAEVLKRYSQIFGSSDSKQFYQWEDEHGNYVNPSKLYVTDDNSGFGAGLYLYAALTDKAQTITLNPNGGTLTSGNKHSVHIGESHTYGELSALPTPTRANYTFTGWTWKNASGVEMFVNDDSVVYDNKELKAQWQLNDYVVNYQYYDLSSDSWTDSGLGATVAANGTVSAAKNTFPTQAQIDSIFALPGYTIVGWEIGDTDVAFKAGSTKITHSMIVRPRYQRTVTLVAYNDITNVSYSKKTITVEIGEPFGAVAKTLPNPGPHDSYTFNGWEVDGTLITVENLGKLNTHPLYFPSLGTSFNAQYIESFMIRLHIHTGGKITADKIVEYYGAPASGLFDMTLINMYSVYSAYGKYDDKGDLSYGWYTPEQWERYATGKSADSGMYYEDIKDKNYTDFHIMLIDVTTGTAQTPAVSGNAYNNRPSTADKTNPTTGDMIFMAITVLAVSGTALALIYIMSKKRKASK